MNNAILNSVEKCEESDKRVILTELVRNNCFDTTVMLTPRTTKLYSMISTLVRHLVILYDNLDQVISEYLSFSPNTI